MAAELAALFIVLPQKFPAAWRYWTQSAPVAALSFLVQNYRTGLATMNPDSEEPFLKLTAAAAGFWLLYAVGTIAILALALWLIKTLWAIV